MGWKSYIGADLVEVVTLGIHDDSSCEIEVLIQSC
jgi:hypothetical protein